jgi:hypothetical protein
VLRRALQQIRDRVRRRQYIVTLHAEEEMDDDGFTMLDVEHALLLGTLEDRQRDPMTSEWKYRLTGPALDGRKMRVMAKLSVTGTLVLITVYDLSGGAHDMRSLR